jgi:hypothetical protein
MGFCVRLEDFLCITNLKQQDGGTCFFPCGHSHRCVDNVWDYGVDCFLRTCAGLYEVIVFYLVKHGVDQELLDDVFAQIKKLFAHERRRKCFMIRITVVTQPSRDLESPAASMVPFHLPYPLKINAVAIISCTSSWWFYISSSLIQSAIIHYSVIQTHRSVTIRGLSFFIVWFSLKQSILRWGIWRDYTWKSVELVKSGVQHLTRPG